MKKEPRWYQKQAYQSIMLGLRDGVVPYVNMCCGTGKSFVAAMLFDKALKQSLKAVQIVPSKELCQQNYDEALAYIDNKQAIGMVCSSLHQKQIYKQLIVATVGSIVRQLIYIGRIDILIIDECDMVSPEFRSMFQKIIRFFRELNPNLKVIGLTGSPYREGIGEIENKSLKGEPTFTKRVFCTDEHLQRLIDEGYLSPLISISADIQADMSDVRINSSGDYDTELMAVKFDAIVDSAVTDIVLKLEAHEINTCLIFASTIANAQHIIDRYCHLADKDSIRLVTGNMPEKEREHTLDWLKNSSGRRIIVNVGVLTRGYNYTGLDCIIFMRATASLRLYVQCVGRVIRASEDKQQGYVIDYGGNIERHGAINDLRVPKPKEKKQDMPKKECTAVIDQLGGIIKTIKEVEIIRSFGDVCGYQNLISAKTCSFCRAEFITDNTTGGYSMRTYAEVMDFKRQSKTITHEIIDIQYGLKQAKNGYDMIECRFINDADITCHKMFLCLNHTGFAQHNSLKILRSMLVNQSDFYRLKEAKKLDVENILTLLQNEEYNRMYFKKVESIKIQPNSKNPKYFDLKEMVFHYDNIKEFA